MSTSPSWSPASRLWTLRAKTSMPGTIGALTSASADLVILDVGCGGGRTVHKLAGIATEGKVYGIDFAILRSHV